MLAKGEQFPDDDWLIKRFVHLTESTVVSAGGSAAGTASYHRYKPGDMVKIPKGTFLYGDDRIEKDIPYDYLMDVFPVTNRQYKEFVDAEKRDVPYRDEDSIRPYNWDKENRTYPKGLDDHPVVLVTHNDAVAYCKWRSKKEGITDPNHYRLPTEEEWEKAARGTDGRVYPWGNDFDFRKLNCADYQVQKVLKVDDEWRSEFREKFYEKNKEKALTSEVGRFADGESPYHCLDMAGNVWEWTDSWYDEDKFRVVRGGSWILGGDYCRCADRGRDTPLGWFLGLGFRCARTL
ncbi:MAG: protein NirV [Candidatus Brocadiaceae bacterium]|nr:protein NirV [Candidatus Brocadiaceae bacterium]